MNNRVIDGIKAMNKKVIAGVIILVLVCGAAIYKVYFTTEAGITATGTVEVTLADVVPKINGYMSELKIEVGDSVKAGQTIARISRPDLDAQAVADESALMKARAQLTDLEKGSRDQELLQAKANLTAAQSVSDKAKTDLARFSVLYRDGAIAAQQLDVTQSAYDVAQSSLVAAQAQQSLVIEGNRPDVIEAQRMEVKRLQAVLDVTHATLADTTVVSPISGVILTKNYQDREYVNPGSAIATVGDLNDCWVKIYVSSSQLGLIRLGQQVEVRIDAYPHRVFAGTIKEIGQNAEFTPRQSITQQERANLVFYVKVKIDNSEDILKPGMPADVVLK
ncbi:MAG: efflux RND transporter periplasmic adaptor subunit [Negativicutes bacterium]|nr:efflux RND transporter periplasmic adaptor subunit [Negativicutes bacterium]